MFKRRARIIKIDARLNDIIREQARKRNKTITETSRIIANILDTSIDLNNIEEHITFIAKKPKRRKPRL